MTHNDKAELWLPSLDHTLLPPLDCLDMLLLLLLACLASTKLKLPLTYLELTNTSMLMEEMMSCPSPCT